MSEGPSSEVITNSRTKGLASLETPNYVRFLVPDSESGSAII